MMGGRGFRVEQLKFRTFIIQFLALVGTDKEEDATIAMATVIDEVLDKVTSSNTHNELEDVNEKTYDVLI